MPSLARSASNPRHCHIKPLEQPRLSLLNQYTYTSIPVLTNLSTILVVMHFMLSMHAHVFGRPVYLCLSGK